MCSSEYNNCFYADAESGEEQLGLPGHVFLHQFPEATPNVNYYSKKEYPLLDDAIQCSIEGSWAAPVFENSSSLWSDKYWAIKVFLNNVNKIFQEFGLQCLNRNQACTRDVNAYQAREDEVHTSILTENTLKKFWKKAKREKGLTHACQELRTVLRSVCEIHELPLAMTWVPCSACNGLRRLEVEFCLRGGSYSAMFLKVSKWSHLRKGLVARRALSSPNMLYCSDISKLSLDEYPLVPYARLCKYHGWFTICLQNVYTGNDIYVLEFFLSTRSKDDENILTTLSFILGTMEQNVKTFRLASGKELGERMFVEVIYFQNDQKIPSIQSIQATREFSMSSIPSSSVQSLASVTNIGRGLHDANMVISKAKYDLNCDLFFDSDSPSDSDPSSMQSSTRVANA